MKSIILDCERKNILDNIKKIQEELFIIENKLNHVTNNILIDSYIYEIKALQARYKFYVDLCKAKKIKFM